jgi:hypothetical protein
MSKPRGRCEIRVTNQSAAIPEHGAPICEPFRSVAHYNRLELAPISRLLPAATKLLHQRADTVAPPNGRCDPTTLPVGAKPWIDLFFVHRGRSCNKQVSGVSLFPRGIA